MHENQSVWLLSTGARLIHARAVLQTTAGAEGDIDVEEHDTEGMFIRIRNKGDDEVPVGGWYLKSIANGKEVSYKFHPRQAIKPGKTMTVRCDLISCHM